ncbi:hypothetical protein [Bacteroides acidifaciens]|uniref:hypothetical protein n=1 Tax=Bacteroides acidifaciens TaxID=85831 RepID=UPI002557CFAF|nr:hypothetical protein [Bacteroides acidifaciens]
MKKVLCIIVGMLCLLPLAAKVKLPAIIGNDMVLQQNTNANLWGWASHSRKITVKTSWDNKTYNHFRIGRYMETTSTNAFCRRSIYHYHI